MENHKLVRPEHLNHYGFLFGGYLLMWVDEIAWIAASLEHPDCLFVTVGMDKVEFKISVRQGNILKFETNRIRTGSTSVTYSVVVKSENQTIFLTDVSLVNVDDKGNKRAIVS